jgi:deferrochelatase/peroxidase EfeB
VALCTLQRVALPTAYVDGRSQPLFLADDFRISGGVRAAERDGSPIGQWDPFEPLERVLRPDPFAPVADCLGSLVVFRKLEQNVRAFAAREQELADRLRLAGEERDRAGALIVGRFRDGTPVVVSPTGGWHPVHDNNFTYNQDPLGRRCPMHAHIRKVNPRGDVLRPKDVATDRLRRITRRGITYGQRGPRPAISRPAASPGPSGGTTPLCGHSPPFSAAAGPAAGRSGMPSATSCSAARPTRSGRRPWSRSGKSASSAFSPSAAPTPNASTRGSASISWRASASW